jgi:NTP pyrophosphatase (non-canonical NTP hydrolase)
VRPTTAVVTKRKFSQKERRERRKRFDFYKSVLAAELLCLFYARQKVIGEKVSDDSSTEEETEKHAADSYNIDNDFEDELWSSDDSPKCLPELGGLDKGGNLQGTEK